jgi:predicted MFS family arabinose efflux permease
MSKKETFQLLQNKEYSFFLMTRVCLTIALQIQAVVVGWQLYKLTKDPFSLGLIGLAEAIPALSIALYAGHVADISNKRNILVKSLLVMVFCSSCLLLVTTDDFIIGIGSTYSIYGIYTFIFLSGFARGFYSPTAFSFLFQLVEKGQLTKASTLNSSAWQIAAIIGPALGGILYAGVGITYTFWVVIGFSIIAMCTLLSIKSKPVIILAVQEKISVRLKEGIKFVFENKVVLSAISLDLFAVLFGGAVALLPVFADEILKIGPQGLGMLRAAPSLGASITIIWLSVRRQISKPGVVLLYCVGAFGICMIGFALSTWLYISLILLFLSGAFDSVSVVIRGNILQLETPDHMRGRVSAVNTMFIGSSNEIGAFESGLAARLLGTVPSVVFGGCMTLLVVGFTSLKAKKLKEFRYK